MQDWIGADHFFKLPRDRSNVNRKWLTRTNFQGSHYGTKAFCPQVGDSVIYIPRAHYDTLQRFPTGDNSGPWKSWPTHQPWPVVRCKVLNIRYRFPYEMYYASSSRRENDGLRDVAAIVTLEVTGVPFSCEDRVFPWPAPVFTAPVASRTRSHDSSFEVTVFDSGLADFVIPELLYTRRIKGLEKAIMENGGTVSDLSVTINYPPDTGDQRHGREDPKYISYNAQIVDYTETDEEEFHFQCSGYNALSMVWTDSNDEELTPVCAWEIQVNGLNDPKNIPQMSTETRDAVNAALKKIMSSDPKVKEWFDSMPDTRIYSDYLLMIEVPMYLQRIRQRLQNNYYTNKNSVVADMELIKENCYKYNEDNNDFYELACQMHTTFKALVDAIPEDPPIVDSDESDQETTIRRGRGVARANNAVSTGQGGRSSNRSRRRLSQQHHQSSLANLPQPDVGRALRRSTRALGNSAQDAGIESSPQDSLQRNRSTSRSMRRSQDAATNNAQDEVRPTRSSARSLVRRTYTEEESEQDERSNSGSDEDNQSTSRSRISSRIAQQSRVSRTSSRPQRKTSGTSEIELVNYQEEPQSPARATRRQTRATRNEATETQPIRSDRPRVSSEQYSGRGRNEEDSYAEDSDNFSEADAQDSDDYEESPPPKKQLKIRARVGRRTGSIASMHNKQPPPASKAARSSSRQRTSVSYAEIGSEEEAYCDEDSSGDEVSAETPPKKKRSRSQLESIGSDDEIDTPQKKQARSSPSRKFIV